ncbi:hypothetical protein TVAG_179820 [Trichomonas vaginalis G3]|uniref:RRM domain-containing protein n=1 Tax=Trichomonas vaginalis (strain ATCC PRA-98 / G3) TaxID=412133 RepID=A2F464_TRIV3|nr:RNA-binding domain, RBD family-containing protein [Trichomonas vaginalis G3]EAY00311.1 hypothetical protein TVAG_179820 [Trichomonas vaginalis G3]KAI5490884.1 RNA-binding domain, RBD family-containing protein [Trichomonas vaginalis G3]|eukprot:XP_001313240.1 hypothetical protein [Trichomonas vaginalis G3]
MLSPVEKKQLRGKMLELTNVPDQSNDIGTISKHFSAFGDISSIYIGSNRAEIKFMNTNSLENAINSSKPFANNRLVKFHSLQRDKSKYTNLAEYVSMKAIEKKCRAIQNEKSLKRKQIRKKTKEIQNNIQDIFTESEKLFIKIGDANETDKKILLKYLKSLSSMKKDYESQLEDLQREYEFM